MFVDSHCHLDFPEFVNDHDGVIARAKSLGVGLMVSIATRKTEFKKFLATAERYPEVYCCLGVHPHYADDPVEHISEEELLKAVEHPKAIGIGETGLDYFYHFASPDVQEHSFRRHLRAAKKADLPVVIHSRDAEGDTLRILKDEKCTKGVLHCFSSKRPLAEEGLALGLYVSLSGILTFRKAEELRAIVRDIPMERLLIETDSPYLAPMPFRGKVCEPAYVVKTAEVLAEIKGVSVETLAGQTTENFFRLFDKCPKELFL